MNISWTKLFFCVALLAFLPLLMTYPAAGANQDDIEAIQVRVLKGLPSNDFDLQPAKILTPDGNIVGIECDYRFVSLSDTPYDRSHWKAKIKFADEWLAFRLQAGLSNPVPKLGDVVTIRAYVYVVDNLEVVYQGASGSFLTLGKLEVGKQAVTCGLDDEHTLNEYPWENNYVTSIVEVAKTIPHAAGITKPVPDTTIIAPELVFIGAYPSLSANPPEGSASAAIEPQVASQTAGSGAAAPNRTDNIPTRPKGVSPGPNPSRERMAPQSQATGNVVTGRSGIPSDSNAGIRSNQPPPFQGTANPPQTRIPGGALSNETGQSPPSPATRSTIMPTLLNVEGEELARTGKIQVNGGQVAAQPMGGFGAGWSGDGQLFWSGGSVGSVLDLIVDIPAAATYALELYPTRAPDYGQVKIQVDGQDARGILEGYSPRVMQPAPRQIGQFSLSQGEHKISFMIVGKNALASDYLVGIDRIRLYPSGPFVRVTK